MIDKSACQIFKANSELYFISEEWKTVGYNGENNFLMIYVKITMSSQTLNVNLEKNLKLQILKKPKCFKGI